MHLSARSIADSDSYALKPAEVPIRIEAKKVLIHPLSNVPTERQDPVFPQHAPRSKPHVYIPNIMYTSTLDIQPL